MKKFLLYCQNMADAPLEALDGRTPLEIAKKPFMDELAKKSVLGMVSWAGSPLDTCQEVTAFSALGYDPSRYFTGLAPLEAAAYRLTYPDSAVVLRCDFVTLLDQTIVDATAGRISAREAQILIQELNAKIKKFNAKIIPMEGHKNLLILERSADDFNFDETQSVNPQRICGEKISKFLPKGRLGEIMKEIMDSGKEILENHEINRVRIDLNENPASGIWLWGQGGKIKLPLFEELFHQKAKLWSECDAWKGAAVSSGVSLMKTWSESEFTHINFAYFYSPEMEFQKDFRVKVRYIEEFDAKIVSAVVKAAQKTKEECQVLVASDVLHSTEQGDTKRAHAPYMLSSADSKATTQSFCEKNCGQSGALHDPGAAFVTKILKN